MDTIMNNQKIENELLYKYLDTSSMIQRINSLIKKIRETENLYEAEKYFFEISDLQCILSKCLYKYEYDFDSDSIKLINEFDRLDDTDTLKIIYTAIKNNSF